MVPLVRTFQGILAEFLRYNSNTVLPIQPPFGLQCHLLHVITANLQKHKKKRSKVKGVKRNKSQSISNKEGTEDKV
ncbi:hypothetical protein Peur_001209 [Populus x canadensis]